MYLNITSEDDTQEKERGGGDVEPVYAWATWRFRCMTSI